MREPAGRRKFLHQSADCSDLELLDQGREQLGRSLVAEVGQVGRERAENPVVA